MLVYLILSTNLLMLLYCLILGDTIIKFENNAKEKFTIVYNDNALGIYQCSNHPRPIYQ